MTGSEYIHLVEGDKCIITNSNNSAIWDKGDIVEVVYKSNIEDAVYAKCRGTCKRIPTIFFLKDMEVCKDDIDSKVHSTIFKHKFNIGDTVWKMRGNRPDSVTITDIEYSMFKNGTKILKYYTIYGECKESDIFATKKELLKSFL